MGLTTCIPFSFLVFSDFTYISGGQLDSQNISKTFNFEVGIYQMLVEIEFADLNNQRAEFYVQIVSPENIMVSGE